MAFYFTLSAIEFLLSGLYMISISSEPGNQFLFNISLSRLTISTILFAVSAVFFFLAVKTARKYKKGEGFLERLLTSKKSLLIISGISIIISALITFILTRSHHFGGEWKTIIKQLEPVLASLLIFSNQTLFFVLLWFSAYFIIHKEKQSTFTVKKELIPVFIIFIVTAVAKWFIVSSSAFGPTGRGDEMTYYDMVDSLNRGFFSVDQTHHYPPLYPLLILPSLSFGQYTYAVIKLTNLMVTTSMIFPTYLIGRSFLDEKRSLIPALLSCLIPYHLVIPMRMVSENLYYPLFLWAAFFVFKQPEEKNMRLFWDILSAVCLGLLYLTRYISLAVIPMFVISWWFKPFDGNDHLLKPSYKKILRFLLICLIAVAVFSPWIIGGLLEDVPVKLTLGFGITSRTNENQLTLANLLTWIALYCLYIVILAAPALPLLFDSIPTLFSNFSKKWKDEYVRFLLEVIFLMSGFLAAASRHSWRAFYNETIPSRIMGRYVAYLLVPFLILGFTRLNEIDRDQDTISRTRKTWFTIISYVMVILAYFTLIERSVFEIGSNFLQPLGSFDAYYPGLLGIVFFLFIGALYFIYWLIPGKPSHKLYIVAGLTCALFYICGWAIYPKEILPIQQYPYLSSEISKFTRDVVPDSELENSISIIVPASADSDQRVELYNGLRVRDIDNTRIIIPDGEEIPEMTTNYGFIIHESVCEDASDPSLMRNAVFLDQPYCIELITK